jgi:peptide/nickel transport system ATP-binding protein/oligopeptide transport system ATP-binding protein
MSKDYVHAVSDVSFEVSEGRTLSLVGESGSGKSTVGKCVLKLVEPTAGSIRLRGIDITGFSRNAMRPLRRDIQVVFQDPFSSLNPRMTAGYIVGEPLTIHGIARGSEKADRVAELFRRVGLRPEQMNRYPHEFSGGQRQRLCIARALTMEPDVIVADEAVSALDVSIQAAILNLMVELQEHHGYAYLFIAHDISVVDHISDEIAVMYLGQIVEIGARDTVMDDPRHPYTQALLSAVPVADPKRRGTRKRTVLKGDIPSPMNPPSGCAFHTRCPQAYDRCRAETPRLRLLGDGRAAACHLTEDQP